MKKLVLLGIMVLLLFAALYYSPAQSRQTSEYKQILAEIAELQHEAHFWMSYFLQQTAEVPVYWPEVKEMQ